MPAALRRPQKKHALEFWSMYFVDFVNVHRFEALLFFPKSGQSDQMTMPARRASNFSTQWRAIKLQIIFQILNSRANPGFCEPWSECQPEESRNDADGDEPTTAMLHSHRQANTHRDQISCSGDTPHSDIFPKQCLHLKGSYFSFIVIHPHFAFAGRRPRYLSLDT